METLHVSKGLEPFWDEHLVDLRHTTAELSSNRPDRDGTVVILDQPWEKQCSYYSIVKDDDCYRMYITKMLGALDKVHNAYGDIGAVISYQESKDGIHWERPVLNICEYQGSTENNIILQSEDPGYGDDYNAFTDEPECGYDAFSVFKDMNPTCPPEERYKGIMKRNTLTPEGHFDPFGGDFVPDEAEYNKYSLVSFVSADGIHFKKHAIVTKGNGHYDSLNTIYWNPHTRKYYCFLRCHHSKPGNLEPRFHEGGVRDIGVIESEDFIHWSNLTWLDYMGGPDIPMYTNCIMPYMYDSRYFVGFPTRYHERRSWEMFPNFERLCGRDDRYETYEKCHRAASALTDCVFMSSRDYYHWKRFDEACITGGPERFGERWMNWRYGDGYPACGMMETAPRVKDAQPEISILVPEVEARLDDDEWPGELYNVNRLVRFVYRKDGFASYKSGYAPKVLRTKPFTFEGSQLKLNFRTSARGYIVLRILDERSLPIEGYTTYEIFGDNVERIIDFDKPLADLQGRSVSFEFTMSDAEIYAMRFE